MKKLSLLLLIGIILVPGVANAQDDDWEKGVQLDAMIQPSKKELRKHRKKMMVEREIDSLIVNRNFRFEAEHQYLYTLHVPRVIIKKRSGCIVQVNRGMFESTLPQDLSAEGWRLWTDAYKITNVVKEEDMTWFMTIELDRINWKLKYEFVVQPTGWTVLRCTSNKWIGCVIYTGWLVITR